MKILIGTPTGNGTITIQYLLAIRALEAHFRQSRPAIESNILFGLSSFMPFSRNALASIVLEDKSYSHLLFVDSDMGFEPEAVMKLIRAGKDVIGCLYPKRTIDYGRFHKISREIDEIDLVRSIAHDYAATEQLQKKIVDTPRGRVAVHMASGGLIKSLRLGMGLTLIRREVFEKMADAIPDIVVDASKATTYLTMGVKKRVIQCFSSVSVDNVSLSEDLSFCRRWTHQCGGDVWACVDQNISHVGDSTFKGRFSDRIDYHDRELLQN